jgi:DNA-binding CsgD family transcriptional regulator
MGREPGGWSEWPLIALLVAIAVGGGLDLTLDRPARWLAFHPIYELGLVAAALATAAWLWSGRRRAERESAELRRSLTERQAERDRWRASAEQSLAGLAAAIDLQFERWELTPAERDVAMRVLRGQSHREIARATGRSERTVRQHAAAAYQKSGVDGRAALAAFFLEGLMLPRERATSAEGDEP